MRHTQLYFEKNGIKLYKTGDKKLPFRIDLTTKDVFNIFSDCVKDTRTVFEADRNVNRCKDHFSKDGGIQGNDWYGWSTEQMTAAGKGEFDLTLFRKQREKLAKFRSVLEEQIKPVGRTRKRTLSEHDGEWQHDRMWEIQPYTATRRETGGYMPTLSIDVDFSFSAGVSSETIAEFGAFCWAIVDSLENMGVTTELAVQNSGYLTSSGGDMEGTNRGLLTNCKVKTAGDYVDTMTLARCFTPGFLRKGIFTAKYAVGEALGETVSSGLSMPFIQERSVVSPGALFLRRADMNQKPEQVAEWVLSALLGETKGEATNADEE